MFVFCTGCATCCSLLLSVCLLCRRRSAVDCSILTVNCASQSLGECSNLEGAAWGSGVPPSSAFGGACCSPGANLSSPSASASAPLSPHNTTSHAFAVTKRQDWLFQLRVKQPCTIKHDSSCWWAWLDRQKIAAVADVATDKIWHSTVLPAEQGLRRSHKQEVKILHARCR